MVGVLAGDVFEHAGARCVSQLHAGGTCKVEATVTIIIFHIEEVIPNLAPGLCRISDPSDCISRSKPGGTNMGAR